MYMYRSNVIVILVLAMAFLDVTQLSAGQSDHIFQYDQKTLQNPVSRKYCGRYLSTTLQYVCNGVYNSMFKKNDQDMELNYENAYEFPIKSKFSANAMGRFGGRRFRRDTHGVYDECCVKSCTMSELTSYCGN